jgi:hypothetical protein
MNERKIVNKQGKNYKPASFNPYDPATTVEKVSIKN